MVAHRSGPLNIQIVLCINKWPALKSSIILVRGAVSSFPFGTVSSPASTKAKNARRTKEDSVFFQKATRRSTRTSSRQNWKLPLRFRWRTCVATNTRLFLRYTFFFVFHSPCHTRPRQGQTVNPSSSSIIKRVFAACAHVCARVRQERYSKMINDELFMYCSTARVSYFSRLPRVLNQKRKPVLQMEIIINASIGSMFGLGFIYPRD